MKRIDICTILLNDSKTERQTISYDPNDKMLHTTAEEDVVDETEYETIEEAEEACYQMWGRSYAWELEWIERDDEEDETTKMTREEIAQTIENANRTAYTPTQFAALPYELMDGVERFWEPGYDYTDPDFWASYEDNTPEFIEAVIRYDLMQSEQEEA